MNAVAAHANARLMIPNLRGRAHAQRDMVARVASGGARPASVEAPDRPAHARTMARWLAANRGRAQLDDLRADWIALALLARADLRGASMRSTPPVGQVA